MRCRVFSRPQHQSFAGSLAELCRLGLTQRRHMHGRRLFIISMGALQFHPLVLPHSLPLLCFPFPLHAPSLPRNDPLLQYYLDSLFEPCYIAQFS